MAPQSQAAFAVLTVVLVGRVRHRGCHCDEQVQLGPGLRPVHCAAQVRHHHEEVQEPHHRPSCQAPHSTWPGQPAHPTGQSSVPQTACMFACQISQQLLTVQPDSKLSHSGIPGWLPGYSAVHRQCLHRSQAACKACCVGTCVGTACTLQSTQAANPGMPEWCLCAPDKPKCITHAHGHCLC